MSCNEKVRNVSHLDQAMDMAGRVRWFIRGAYQGGGKVKRLARDFDWSHAKAKRVFEGESIRQQDVEKMARRWGWRFVQFIYSPVVGGVWGPDDVSQHVVELKAAVQRIEACVVGASGAVRDAWVLSRADAAPGGRALSAGGADLPRVGEALPAGGGEGERVVARDAGLKAAAE